MNGRVVDLAEYRELRSVLADAQKPAVELFANVRQSLDDAAEMERHIVRHLLRIHEDLELGPVA